MYKLTLAASVALCVAACSGGGSQGGSSAATVSSQSVGGQSSLSISSDAVSSAGVSSSEAVSSSLVSSSISSSAQSSASSVGGDDTRYTFNNVLIGGGGFVPGIIFNESEPNLIYARTDIGGMYRWQEDSQRWKPLLDWIDSSRWGWNGVLSVATDPVDPNNVYAALGTYLNDWQPHSGAIARSRDKGETWQVTELPFKIGGNMPGRGMGERLRVDPNNNQVIYFGAEAGEGLWRSVDAGVTWSEVASFPNAGNYVADPDYPYSAFNQGVVWVVFDPRSASAGQTTQTIYAGVADKQNPLYRSTDGGNTWQAVAGTPKGYLPHKGLIDPINGFLYMATSDTGGPYDGAEGAVHKLNLATGAWQNITPSDTFFGFSGLTIDRQNPQTLMVTSMNTYWPDGFIYRTTDGGASWKNIYEYGWDEAAQDATIVSRSYEFDFSGFEWLTFNKTKYYNLPAQPSVGWMMEAMAIDPFNPDRFFYGTGATIYGATNLTNWDSSSQITLRPMVHGVEETAVNDLIALPGDIEIISGLFDIAGFRHFDVSQPPGMMMNGPFFGTTTGLDFAEQNTDKIVRVGKPVVDTETQLIAISTDRGVSWQSPNMPAGASGGHVAISADGEAIIWAPDQMTPQVTFNDGQSWQQVAGLPMGATVEADRVNANRIYAHVGTSFYVSTDKGRTFSAAATNLQGTRFTTIPGFEGHIYLAYKDGQGGGSLAVSSDGGMNFTQITGVDMAASVAHGKAAPGSDYPTLYMMGTYNGVRGLFRSTDRGQNWLRINDDANQWANAGDSLAGDPDKYGRVYVGTNGRGIVYGDIAN